MNDLSPFFDLLVKSFEQATFVKLTLSKPFPKSSELQNVYVRLVEIQEEINFSFTYHYTTKDEVKNYRLKGAQAELNKLLNVSFKNAMLFTTDGDLSVQISKKGKVSIKSLAATFTEFPSLSHDKPKQRKVEQEVYLNLLGICDDQGNVIPKMADKFKQINKYLEIVDAQLKHIDTSKELSIVDMGAGKGYLTFALYDYLVNQKSLKAKVVGIEQRLDLVEFCNKTAKACAFDGLTFEQKNIQEFDTEKVDVLIALHACDTATDDAIAKGIGAKAQLIITAPCCHKQVRQQVKGKEQESPLLKYGIFKERQFEMVTDTIRALILEQHQYSANIFQFVSNEHTRKNVMLIGVKSNKKLNSAELKKKLSALKQEFGVTKHFLEELV